MHQITSRLVMSPSYTAQVEELEQQGRRLLDAAAAGMALRVPSCPGWDVAELVAHLAHIYGWAARNLLAGPEERVRLGRPAGDGLEGCANALDQLVRALRTLAPESRCAGPIQSRTAAWWARRQLLETVVHRWDVENAVGSPPEIDDAVAALGMAEFLEVFAGGSPLPVTVSVTNAELLLLLWGRVSAETLLRDRDCEAYRAWRTAIAT